ncbi:hypothetical protein ACG7TL_003978 [Trametes sanguinea]
MTATTTVAIPVTTVAYPDALTANDLPPSDAHLLNQITSKYDYYVTLSDLSENAPSGWTMHTHPRGYVYWSNASCQVVVDEDVRQSANLARASKFCDQCADLALDEGMEAYMIGGMDVSFCLFVNHRQCAAGYDLSKMRNDAITDQSSAGLLRARRLYWNFVAHHPAHSPCSPHGFEEAIDALRSYYHEHLMYGSHCIAPFSKTECEELLSVLRRAKEEEDGLPATTALLGWVLKDVYSFRAADRFGQVTRDELKAYRESLSKPRDFAPRQSSATRLLLLFLIVGPFFGIPQTYLEQVKSASEFRGHIAGLRENWESYTLQLVREYSDFILIATVLLGATVGLLTINDIGETCKGAAMISAFAALGSITVGVFFVWRHQRNARMPASFTYLHNARNSALGLSGHALLLSLPPVLLVWSLVAFTVAVVAYAMQEVNQAATWVVFAAFVVILLAVMAGVYTFSTIWQWQSNEGWWAGLFRWRRRIRSRKDGLDA